MDHIVEITRPAAFGQRSQLLSEQFGSMGKRGDGSIRERHPGIFEIRVAISIDPRSGRTVQRSFSFHGSRGEAEARRREVAEEFAKYRAARRSSPFLTVGELMERFVAAPHDWRPATLQSSAWMAEVIGKDPIALTLIILPAPAAAALTLSIVSRCGERSSERRGT